MLWIALIIAAVVSLIAADRAYKRHLDILTGPWIKRLDQ